MTETPAPVVNPAPSSTGTPAGTEPAAVPAAQAPPVGFVPQSELDAERQRARAFQSEKDRVEAELVKLRAATPAAPGTGATPPDGSGFDPDRFREQLLTDVKGVMSAGLGTFALRAEATELKAKFPHANWATLEGQLDQFASKEALFIAAEADHKRVADIIASMETAEQKAERERLAAINGGQGGPAGAGGGAGAAGTDPTPEQVAAMSMSELDALEARSPGALDRIKARVSAGAA